MTETPASGQEADDEVTTFVVADRQLYLRKPTDGQIAVLMLMAGIDPADGFSSIIANLGAVEEVMASLCVPPSEVDDESAIDVRTLKRMMARGEIELEEYFGPAVGLAERWGDQEELTANRSERRQAAKKAPAKKATAAVARPGRTRR